MTGRHVAYKFASLLHGVFPVGADFQIRAKQVGVALMSKDRRMP